MYKTIDSDLHRETANAMLQVFVTFAKTRNEMIVTGSKLCSSSSDSVGSELQLLATGEFCSPHPCYRLTSLQARCFMDSQNASG